jgi:hypothetical protein
VAGLGGIESELNIVMRDLADLIIESVEGIGGGGGQI